MRPFRRRLACALPALTLTLAALVSSASFAQDRIWTVEGREPGIRFGSALARVGDLDGDGIPEIAAGAPAFDRRTVPDAGRLYVLSGTGLDALFLHTGLDVGEQLGGAIDGGFDLDGDGTFDILAGAGASTIDCGDGCIPPSVDGGITVFSGATGDRLLQIEESVAGENLGASVAFVPDLDGDDVPDIAAGSTGIVVSSHSEAGRFAVYSGADGSVLYRIDGTRTRQRIGASIARLGDANGDGHPDLAVGAPGYLTTTGSVLVLSGPGPASVAGVAGRFIAGEFGYAVAAVDDFDGDALPELMVGAPHAGATGGGEVTIYGSASLYQNVLRRYDSDCPDAQLGFAVADAGDVDGDGIGDHAIGAPGVCTADGRGLVQVLSGVDGSLIFESTGEENGDRYGHALLGGINGPFYSDVLVGSPASDPEAGVDAGLVDLRRIAISLDCLRGNVNAGAGIPRDVLTVNGSIGAPGTRIVRLDRDEPLVIAMEAPPSRVQARFAMYAYAGFPNESTVKAQPQQTGDMCFATPYDGTFGLPRIIWNNLGEPFVFGKPDFPSQPAPSLVFEQPNGVGRRARGTVQALIRDDAALGTDGLAITNAVLLDVR